MLQNLLIGIENMGDNLKNIRKEMGYQRNPEVREAEREDAEIEKQLLTEVPPPNPVSTGPSGADVPPESQHQYAAQRPNIFPIGGLEGILAASTTSEFVTVIALRKPYLGAPESVNQGTQASTGFNLGSIVQSTLPQFFTMGSSTSLGMRPPAVNIQKGTKSAPNTNLEPKSRPGWYYSEMSDRWQKTKELLEKERRDVGEAEKLAGEASQPTATSSTKISVAQAAGNRAPRCTG